MTSSPEKYYVRFSKTEDFDKILEFYEMNAHKNVVKRDLDLMKKMTDEGAVILIEDSKGKIVASSITYPHKVKDANGVEHIKWQELGTTRIALNGYPGLFDAMVTMQALRTFLVEPPEERFIAHMITDPVQKMANRLGWRRLDAAHISDELVECKKKSVAPGVKVDKVDWFHCGAEAIPGMAAWMVKAMDSPVLENKKTGEKIQLDFSKSTFFKFFETEIRNIAKKNFGDIEKPDMAKGMREQQQNWMKYKFR